MTSEFFFHIVEGLDIEEINSDENIPLNLRWTQERSKKRRKLLSPSKQIRQSKIHTHPMPKWVDAENGRVPAGAVIGGCDAAGKPIYVARANHEKSLIPGKLEASRGCTISWRGTTHAKNKYQVLVNGPNNWVQKYSTDIPPDAIIGGKSDSGRTLYVGRLKLKDGSHICGYVMPCLIIKCCCIPYKDMEIECTAYEILCDGRKF